MRRTTKVRAEFCHPDLGRIKFEETTGFPSQKLRNAILKSWEVFRREYYKALPKKGSV